MRKYVLKKRQFRKRGIDINLKIDRLNIYNFQLNKGTRYLHAQSMDLHNMPPTLRQRLVMY